MFSVGLTESFSGLPIIVQQCNHTVSIGVRRYFRVRGGGTQLAVPAAWCSRGVRGHAPPENFEIQGTKYRIFLHSNARDDMNPKGTFT